METELQTYKHSRQGLDEMYNEARRQLRDESQLRQVGYIENYISKIILGVIYSLASTI